MAIEKFEFKPVYFVFAGLFILVAIGVHLWQYRADSVILKMKGERLKVLLADTPARQYRGLGGRDNIEGYGGMLFLFGTVKRHGIVMRDMRFPIDIIWIHEGKVVDIAPNVQTEPGASEMELRGYYPRVEANTVLEMPAGWVDQHGLQIGDAVEGVEE